MSDSAIEKTKKLLKLILRVKSDEELEAALAAVRTLDLSGDPWKTRHDPLDLEPLRACRQLEELNLCRQPVISFLPLNHLKTTLRALDVSEADRPHLESFLIETSLKILKVNKVPSSFWIETLPQMVDIEVLEASGCGLRTLGEWKAQSTLKTLRLDENSLTQVPNLTTASSLVRLSLAKNMISNLRPIAHLKTLRYLSVADNGLESLDDLSSCWQLEELDISLNRIRSLSPLRDLRDLRWLGIRGNPLDDEELERVSRQIRFDT